MNKILLLASLLVILFLNLAAYAQQAENKNMTVTELKEKMHKDSLVVLDVRTPEELTGPLGHIDGIINIPLQELKQRVHELDKYKNREIAVICRSGNRSSTATGYLTQVGFNAVNVEGGMIAYRKAE